MKAYFQLLIFLFMVQTAWSQEAQLTITGKVLDAKTKEPLENATIEVKSRSIEFISLDGTFEFHLPSGSENDSLEISYIGYKPFKKRIGEIKNPENVYLQDYSIELRTVTITSRMLKLKDIERSLRRIKGNLYASETETTNGLYNLFLSYLEEHDQMELLKQCDYDLTAYDEEMKAFYKKYASPYVKSEDKKDSLSKDYTNYPAVNINHGAAIVFCKVAYRTVQYKSG